MLLSNSLKGITLTMLCGAVIARVVPRQASSVGETASSSDASISLIDGSSSDQSTSASTTCAAASDPILAPFTGDIPSCKASSGYFNLVNCPDVISNWQNTEGYDGDARMCWYGPAPMSAQCEDYCGTLSAAIQNPCPLKDRLPALAESCQSSECGKGFVILWTGNQGVDSFKAWLDRKCSAPTTSTPATGSLSDGDTAGSSTSNGSGESSSGSSGSSSTGTSSGEGASSSGASSASGGSNSSSSSSPSNGGTNGSSNTRSGSSAPASAAAQSAAVSAAASSAAPSSAPSSSSNNPLPFAVSLGSVSADPSRALNTAFASATPTRGADSGAAAGLLRLGQGKSWGGWVSAVVAAAAAAVFL
ncbi:hypothetical protein JCM6882_002030 [Rhodosporidiobolus microsporus]